jgi:hypothetical protein
MWGRVAIGIAAGAAAVVVWYLVFVRYNQRQGERMVARIQAALAGSGQVLAVRWLGSSTFQVALRMATGLFQHPGIMVRLVPRPNPIRWLQQWWRRAPATATFEADFHAPPAFNLQLGRHRWSGRTRRRFARGPGNWQVDRPTPIILTSRPCWPREVTRMMNSLLSRRDREVLSLDFRPTSPHFSATVRLEAITLENDRVNIFDTLRELAAEVSASRR